MVIQSNTHDGSMCDLQKTISEIGTSKPSGENLKIETTTQKRGTTSDDDDDDEF